MASCRIYGTEFVRAANFLEINRLYSIIPIYSATVRAKMMQKRRLSPRALVGLAGRRMAPTSRNGSLTLISPGGIFGRMILRPLIPPACRRWHVLNGGILRAARFSTTARQVVARCSYASVQGRGRWGSCRIIHIHLRSGGRGQFLTGGRQFARLLGIPGSL